MTLKGLPTSPGIYRIVHVPSGRAYIGSAVSLAGRARVHLCLLKKGTHHSRYLQRAWIKHGGEAFRFEIAAHVVDRNELIAAEQARIDAERPVFNGSPKAGSQIGRRNSAESRQRISDAQRGKKRGPYSAERCKAVSDALIGHSVSAEARAKISAALSGRKRGPISDEVRLKISLAQKGKPREYARAPKSLEHREKIRQSHLRRLNRD